MKKIIIDKYNFYNKTQGLFKIIAITPKEEPDFISYKKGSIFYIDDDIVQEFWDPDYHHSKEEDIQYRYVSKDEETEEAYLIGINSEDVYENRLIIRGYREEGFMCQDIFISSKYWYSKEGVYRCSDHWGDVAECKWNLNSSHQKGETVIGFCKWEDFEVLLN